MTPYPANLICWLFGKTPRMRRPQRQNRRFDRILNIVTVLTFVSWICIVIVKAEWHFRSDDMLFKGIFERRLEFYASLLGVLLPMILPMIHVRLPMILRIGIGIFKPD